MAQLYPIDVARDFERRWSRRSRPVPRNGNRAGGGRCPACNVQAVAPAASEYRGNGAIHHHWLCHSCGNQWLTVLHVACV